MDNLAAYTEIPYSGQVTSWTHPDNIAVVARLLGVPAVDPRSARVLEIGCADGGNLVPMAARLPGAHFVGVDLAPEHVRRAAAFARAAQVDNVDVEVGDVACLRDLGTFDYVIAHGVWSWIPPHARRALLRTCADCLSDDGVAYVSYNVWPGWSQRLPIRKMLLWHTRDIPGGRDKVAAAKALAGWLASLPPNRRMIGTAMKSVLAEFSEFDDWYVFHEYLAAHNDPVLFQEFADAAAEAGLAYLGDANLPDMAPFDLPEAVQDDIAELATDRISYEQILDMVRERAFRKSLLVRAGRDVDYNVDTARLTGLHVGGRLRLPSDWTFDDTPRAVASWPVGGPPTSADEVRGIVATTAAEKRVLAAIAASWPRTVPVDDLVDIAPEQAGAIRRRLLVAVLEGALHLFASPQDAAPAGPRPRVLPVTVAELDFRGDGYVSNRWHGRVKLDRVQRWLLRHLDGTRTREELADILTRAFRERTIPVPMEVVGGDDAPRRWLDGTLSVFADSLLLATEVV